nr:MAG TPA: hypothetical protein [Caudoviricetes sp.]
MQVGQMSVRFTGLSRVPNCGNQTPRSAVP